jgi:hypothetical protein
MITKNPLVEIECSIVGCGARTTEPKNDNPRLRWIVGLKLENKILNMCPTCVREIFNLDSNEYDRLEGVEKFIREEVM